jgi:hypothetical protein
MKYFLFLFLLLACEEPYNECNMTISDASEIQFWPVGTPSFNLEEEGYTDHYCFNQKFLCTGNRRFQGIDTEDINPYLIGFDEQGDEIFNQAYIKSSNLFLQPLADGVDDDWIADSSVHQPWTTGAAPSITISSPSGRSAYFLLKIYGAESMTDYAFDYSILRGISGTGQITLYVIDQAYYDAGGIGSPLGGFSLSTTNGTFVEEGTFNFTGVAGVPAYFMVLVYNNTGTTSAEINSIDLVGGSESSLFTYNLTMNPYDNSMCDKKVQFKIFDGDDPETDTELYYSDPVYFPSVWANTNHSGRVVIQFKSVVNFAGLIYNESSEYFSIELDGRFRKGKLVTAQKSLELSNVVLNLATSVKAQKVLTIDDVPDYMHKKITLGLAHTATGTVLVNDLEISVEEGYEEGDRPGTYPLTPAEIVLTDKNYYKHNIL